MCPETQKADKVEIATRHMSVTLSITKVISHISWLLWLLSITYTSVMEQHWYARNAIQEWEMGEFGVMFTYTGTISPRQFIPAARQEPWNKASELIRLPHLIRHPQQRGLSGNAVMDSAGSTSARAPLTAGGKSDLGVSQQHLCQAEGHDRKKQWTWEKTFMRDLYTDPLP